MKKILNFIKALFSKSDPYKANRVKIVEFIDKIKNAVESPVATAIVEAIPGRTDDKILEGIRKWIPIVLKGLDLAQNGLNAHIAIREAVKRLKDVPKPERAAYYKMMGGELYKSFTDLPIETAIEEIQIEYRSA